MERYPHLILLLAAVLPVPAAAFELNLPIACTPGIDCVIQSYVDRDPGPGAVDYLCGSQSYDGHKGTDFRVPSMLAMMQGVSVLAAADGVVTGIRDEMPDVLLDRDNPGAVEGRECGNGLVIDHGDGWETQYCHMKKGSVAVSPGTAVKAGDVLGEVGLSGNTEFPHLHLSVRKDGTVVDPFLPTDTTETLTCPSPGDATGLWSDAATEDLIYRPAFVLTAGFANAALELDEVESGTLDDITLTVASPALVFYGLAIGLDAGDIQVLAVVGPDNEEFVSDRLEPLDRAKAQYFAFAGKAKRETPWPAGTYLGRYSVVRDGKEIAFREAEIELQ